MVGEKSLPIILYINLDQARDRRRSIENRLERPVIEPGRGGAHACVPHVARLPHRTQAFFLPG